MIDIRVRCDDWKMMSVWFDVARKNGYADDRAAMIRDALACLGLNLAVIGIFVLASIVLNTVLANFTKWGAHQFFPNHPAVAGFLLEAVSFLVSALVFTGVFAAIFKYLPDVKIDWKPGHYYFQCDPHALLGMKGSIKVEEREEH